VVDADGRTDDLVRNALGRFPEERYPNARAFLRAVCRARTERETKEGSAELAAWVVRVISEPFEQLERVSGLPETASPARPRASDPTVDLRPSQRNGVTPAEPTITEPHVEGHRAAAAAPRSRKAWPIALGLGAVVAVALVGQSALRQSQPHDSTVKRTGRLRLGSVPQFIRLLLSNDCAPSMKPPTATLLLDKPLLR